MTRTLVHAGSAFVAILCAALVAAPRCAHAIRNADLGPTWNVQLALGPYKPRISPTQLQRDFYDLMFAPDTKKGDGSLFKNHPLMKTVEIDWYAARAFGVVGVVGRFGHWRTTGATRACSDAAGDFTTCNSTTVFESQSGADKASLTVVPLSVGGIYRMDYLKRRWGIPLVLHTRLAVDYNLWWASAGDKTSKRGSLKGNGGVFGIEGMIGAALALGWIDPNSSRRGLLTSGITDSYLSFEVTRFEAGFDEQRLDLSDTIYSLGLALEFQ